MSCRERANHHRSAERSLSYVFEGVTFRSCSLCIKNMANKLNITVLYIEIIFFLGGGEWAFLIEDMIPDLFPLSSSAIKVPPVPRGNSETVNKDKEQKTVATESNRKRRAAAAFFLSL